MVQGPEGATKCDTRDKYRIDEKRDKMITNCDIHAEEN